MVHFEIAALLTGIIFIGTFIILLSLVALSAFRDYSRARQAMRRITRSSTGSSVIRSNGEFVPVSDARQAG